MSDNHHLNFWLFNGKQNTYLFYHTHCEVKYLHKLHFTDYKNNYVFEPMLLSFKNWSYSSFQRERQTEKGPETQEEADYFLAQ